MGTLMGIVTVEVSPKSLELNCSSYRKRGQIRIVGILPSRGEATEWGSSTELCQLRVTRHILEPNESAYVTRSDA